MSNENSNLRVGSAGAGLFVGGTEILGGGGIANLLKEITIAPDFINMGHASRILIANLSDNDEITLEREGSPTIIPARHIEWYSLNDYNRKFNVSNYGDIPVRCLSAHVESGSAIPNVAFEDLIANRGDHCINYTFYFTALLIFNTI
jgi:hypothetical protein